MEEGNIERNNKILMCLVVLFALIIGVVVFVNRNNIDEPEEGGALVAVPNSSVNVDSVEEMQQYLGFVPNVLSKDVTSYLVVDNGSSPIGRIVYLDGSTYSISKKNGNISDISGGEEEEKRVVNGVSVSIYRVDDTRYTYWEDEKYSYAFSASADNTNFISDLESLIYPKSL